MHTRTSSRLYVFALGLLVNLAIWPVFSLAQGERAVLTPSEQEHRAVVPGSVHEVTRASANIEGVGVTDFSGARFDWSMAPRFLDRNSNGIPDLPNTFEFVHNLPNGACTTTDCSNIVPKFNITFDGSSSAAHLIEHQGEFVVSSTRPFFSWKIVSLDGQEVASSSFTSSPVWNTRLPEGAYEVSLTVALAGSTTASGKLLGVTVEETSVPRIRFEDILIVSIGDSLSSGVNRPGFCGGCLV